MLGKDFWKIARIIYIVLKALLEHTLKPDEDELLNGKE